MQQTILDQYDEQNKSTPIHKACWENNVEILALLLKYNPNVNLLYEPNVSKFTTMHIAEINKNAAMMKLLIQHGFDCDKFINSIYYQDAHNCVFLELCFNGDVERMDYLMNQCKNKIDIWQRSINGNNGLHLAVGYQHLSMVKYLLDNVYKNDEMKRKILNQPAGINGMHISLIAAQRGTTQDGLCIFKLLKKNKCPLHPDTIAYAASHSSLILEYMLKQQLYPNYDYLTKQLIVDTLGNADTYLVHKNILIIVKYLSNMKDIVSTNDYKQWIVNVFDNIMIRGTMDGYFKMLKKMIEILLNNHDWKCFTTSKMIDKTLLIEIQQQIHNPTNMQNTVDNRWCFLLQTMIDSFDDQTLLSKYDYDNHNKSDFKTNDNEGNDVIKLIQFLKNEEFEQFAQVIEQYTKTKQENSIKTISNKSNILLYWIWNGKVILPFYKHKNRAEATTLSLKYLFENGSNINTTFNTNYIKNQTLFNMIKQNQNMYTIDSLQMLIDYKFNFEKFTNVYDNVKRRNGLIELCTISPHYTFVKMLFDHCKTVKCKIDITHCDIKKQNALFYAAMNDINTFKYFLSNKCFSNYDKMDQNVQIALNQKDIFGSTVAHIAANNPRPHIVDTFKLLKRHNFNFNVYDHRGRLPIHLACETNCASLLSWMIEEKVFDNDINCKTKYASNKTWDGQTPLYTAVRNNSVECVDVLCKQTQHISIEKRDIYGAVNNDNVKALKFLLCGLYRKCKISSWNDIESLQSLNMISINQIKSMISWCNKNVPKKHCKQYLIDLFAKGYSIGDFEYIVLKLDYNLKTVMNDNDDMKHDDQISSLYEITQDLGNGTFGQVKLGKNKKSGNEVAIKHIAKSSSSIQFITSEIESLKKLSTHQNIINLSNYMIHNDEVLLYFEYCQYGDLYKLLNQCDYFSMRISFKYFLQLLSAINTCHKMNIVHRDLKLQNILLSDTFQLIVADFGLASIDNENDKICNVGTPMYQSPELLENHTNYAICNLEVLKSCDVFSLSIIFWQLMNGIEYLPFRLYKKPINIKKTKYQYIKYGQYNQFWATHKNSNMMKISDCCNNGNVDSLLNLFEEMFEYNPYQRITIDKILRHDWVAKHENDLSFYMTDCALEAFVRARFHETDSNKRHYVSFHSGVAQYTPLQNTQQSEFKQSYEVSSDTDSFNINSFVKQMNAQDSSHVIPPNNAPLILKNKIYCTFKPLVVMVGIQKYKNIKNKQKVLNNYINVKTMLNELIKFDLIYQNEMGQIIYNNIASRSVVQSMFDDNDAEKPYVNQHFQMEWTGEELNKFNQYIVSNIINDKKNNYDGLIYFVSSHMKHDNKYQHYLYDSNDQLYHCNKHIFDVFNNANCERLYKKPKIFILDGFDPNADEKQQENESRQTQERVSNDKKVLSMVDNDEIEFVDQYKRVLYSNCDWSILTSSDSNDGNLLINLFCVSLSNNIGIKNSASDLNNIIQQTQQRVKRKADKENLKYGCVIYDQNYIPSRCRVVFTSFKPLKSVESYFQSEPAYTLVPIAQQQEQKKNKEMK